MNKEMKEKPNILQHFIFFLSVISSETDRESVLVRTCFAKYFKSFFRAIFQYRRLQKLELRRNSKPRKLLVLTNEHVCVG
jgi:hypothetical protein